MKTLFSYFQEFSLSKVRKARLQADFVTNNQILVVKIIKIRTPFYSDPRIPPHPPRLFNLPPSFWDLKVDKKISQFSMVVTILGFI